MAVRNIADSTSVRWATTTPPPREDAREDGDGGDETRSDAGRLPLASARLKMQNRSVAPVHAMTCGWGCGPSLSVLGNCRRAIAAHDTNASALVPISDAEFTSPKTNLPCEVATMLSKAGSSSSAWPKTTERAARSRTKSAESELVMNRSDTTLAVADRARAVRTTIAHAANERAAMMTASATVLNREQG